VTAQVYRFYSGDVIRDMDYMFSIVANEKQAQYVVAEGRKEAFSAFDKDRIQGLTLSRPEEEIPTTPEGWALLAAYNINGIALHPIEGETAEEIDDLIADEQTYADAMDAKYGEDYI
jgi:hypothetical protein